MLAQGSGFPTAFNPLETDETDENQAIWVGVRVLKGAQGEGSRFPFAL